MQALLDARYPLIGSTRSGPWRGTVLHGARNKQQTLKMIRLMGEYNPSLEQLMSQSGASNRTAVETRKKVRGFCKAWQKSMVFDEPVEIDELMLRGKKSKGRKNQAVLVIAGKDGKQCIYLPIKDQKSETILPLIQKHVAPGCRIYTDGWVGYKRLKSLGYDHRPKKEARLPMVHAAIASWRSFLGKDKRPEVDLAGKCAHASLLYSHRHIGKGRADALLDACMEPGRPRRDSGSHVIRLSINPSRVEQNMLYRRLHHQDLFMQLLQRAATRQLDDLHRSRAWRNGTPKERKDLWSKIEFSQYDLESKATEILQKNPDIANYVDRATANGLVMEVYSSFNKAMWSGAKLPQFRRRDTWHGSNQRQGLRVVAGYLVHTTAKLRDDRALHIPLSWHSIGKKRQSYYEERMSCLRRVGLKREWVRGKPRWFVLLTFECLPYREEGYLKSLAKDGVVGLDANKGGIGVAAPKKAQTIELSELAKDFTDKANRLRSERDKIKARNPDWENSKRYWRAHQRFTRASRNARLARDQAWLQVARSLRQAGKTVITEKDHIRGWRQNKNKKDTIAQSVAPARLKQLIKTEFQATSGEYIEVTAKLVKATATCPECGKVQGKDTSQRVHDCNCGCKMDRDTAAAINLARYQLQKKQSYPIRSRGVLSWDANASGSTGGQLVVSTIIDTSVAKRSHTEKLDFNKFRE